MHSPWDAVRLRDLIGSIMRKTGLSQRGLARLGGFSESQIGRWLKGETQPQYDTIRRLAEGIIREYPALGDMVPDLFSAAGYNSASVGGDPRPEVVREHWDDKNVRTLWGLSVSVDQRLALIEAFIASKARPGDGDEASDA
jgi:transcriptional regulator with XRE-family HTH domain